MVGNSTAMNPTARGSAIGQTKLRVLALHSFRTSGAIFKQQFERGMMIERLSDLIDLVFIDAPNPASGLIPRDVLPYFKGPYYEWFTVETMGDKLEYDVAKLERSLELVCKTLKEQGPFDGIIGFSQGAACAASIVALQQAGMALQDVPPLQFCILFAGFKSRYPPHAAAWKDRLRVPSLHVFGDRDELRPQCKELADVFNDPVVLQHTRGHSIPVLAPAPLAAMRAFLASFTPMGTTTGMHSQDSIPSLAPPSVASVQRRNTTGTIEQRKPQNGDEDGVGLDSLDLGGNDGPTARL